MKKFLKWLDNFWYHYKWHTLIITFFAAILVIGVVQMAKKTDPDITLLYAGPAILTEEGIEELEKTFASALSSDTNGDGEKVVRATNVVLLSDEQLKEKQEEAAAEGDSLYYDVSLRSSAFEQIKNWLITGEMLLCLLDPYVYERFAGQDLFMPLADILDEIPESAHDAYSIDFSKTEFGRFYTALEPVAEGALLCLVKPTYLANIKTEGERYQAHVALVKEILSFTVL